MYLQEDTFQAVLATDGDTSVVFFIYGAVEGVFANIGFRSDEGSRSFMLPGALTTAVADIEFQSNVGVPGLYIYRVDLPVIIELNGKSVSYTIKIKWLIIYSICFVDTSVFVSFDVVEYTTSEDESPLEVCVSADGLQGSSVTVSLSTTNFTGTGVA